MARIHTHYDNLKVARDAPPEVIRAAYKTLSQKYHPDRHGNSAEAIRIIQIINSAYAVLSDPAKRREHDDWISRNEVTASRIGEPEFRECSISRPSVRRSSRRSHRRHSFGYYYLRYEMSLQRAANKLRMMLDRYSRKLFRKT
jgi:curved DNA-binding protein CbpA